MGIIRRKSKLEKKICQYAYITEPINGCSKALLREEELGKIRFYRVVIIDENYEVIGKTQYAVVACNDVIMHDKYFEAMEYQESKERNGYNLFLDKKLNPVSDTRYTRIDYNYGIYIYVRISNQGAGLLNSDLQTFIEPKYKEVVKVAEDKYAGICKNANDKMQSDIYQVGKGYMQTFDGLFLLGHADIPMEYHLFSDGEKLGVYDKNFKVVIEPRFTRCGDKISKRGEMSFIEDKKNGTINLKTAKVTYL